jgi:hypothetical protein
MAKYVDILPSDMALFLEERGFIHMHLDGVKEYVYGKAVAKNVTLRVFTSIDPYGTRECGEDAIRAVLVGKRKDGKIVELLKLKRVHRVEGWKTNLDKRLSLCYNSSSNCPKCQAPMAKRKGKYGEFWGCIEYPECTATRRIGT